MGSNSGRSPPPARWSAADRPMTRILSGALLLVVFSLSLLVPGAEEPREALALEGVHLELRRTLPPADSVARERPTELRLFFSESPRSEATRVRLTDAADELVPSSETLTDGEDPRQVYIRFEAPLPDGAYTAHWRTIARDGHAQNGTFRFRVQGG
jgi:methionine-rich copper-binding protein CopC